MPSIKRRHRELALLVLLAECGDLLNSADFSRGDFIRDPANVRRELRDARGEQALAWITSHTFRQTAATILDEAALPGDWSLTSSATRGRR